MIHVAYESIKGANVETWRIILFWLIFFNKDFETVSFDSGAPQSRELWEEEK